MFVGIQLIVQIYT